MHKYRIPRKSVQWEPRCFMRTDRNTGRHDEGNTRFLQFCKRASKSSSSLPDNETHDNTTVSAPADKIMVLHTPELRYRTSRSTQSIRRATVVLRDSAHLSLSTAQELPSLLCNQPRTASQAQRPRPRMDM